jgi:UDP-N-acetylglucosamine 2-epimerase (non-hydrolysing)
MQIEASHKPLLILIGTKAQFIKTAPILNELDARGTPYRLIYTGQHSETFDLLEVAFSTRTADDQMVPNMEASTHNKFLRWAISYWKQAFKRRLSWQGSTCGIVHGDTASTLFGAMALRYAGVPVVHVEAGLRSAALLEPFPEELIRRCVSRLASLHLVPDPSAARNLIGISGDVVDTQGNTLRDALAMALGLWGDVPAEGGHGGYAVVSMHRSENLGRKQTFDFLMGEIMAIADVLPVMFVMHPTTREKIQSSGWLEKLRGKEGLTLTERMDYPEFVKLLVGSCCLFTDGGSNQEEASMMGLPTLLLRNETERPDGLGSNVSISKMRPGSAGEFAKLHAGKTWSLSFVTGPSPSACVVDAIERRFVSV